MTPLVMHTPTCDEPAMRAPAGDVGADYAQRRTPDAGDLHAAYEQLFRFAGDLQTAVAERNQAKREMADAYFETMFLLAMASDFREGRNRLRLVRIGLIAERLAEAIGRPADYCRCIRRAAPLHDIGMVAIPDDLLFKKDDLNDAEWRLWRSHTQIGAHMLNTGDAPEFRMAAEIALTHHENYHGKGYPAGLSGKAIPLSGRITALAEYFESHTAEFEVPGRASGALPPGIVLAAIRDYSGRRFDPELVDGLLNNLQPICEARRSVESSSDSLQSLVQLSRLPI